MADYCYECDFDYDAVIDAEVPATLRAFPAQFADALVGDRIRVKPSPWSWSALEIVCHTRDAFGLYVDRVNRVLTEEHPSMKGMERDGLAIAEKYNEQDPDRALAALDANADALADVLQTLSGAQWDTFGMHPVRGEMTIRWMAANCVHEGRHHLMDVTRVLKLVATRSA